MQRLISLFKTPKEKRTVYRTTPESGSSSTFTLKMIRQAVPQKHVVFRDARDAIAERGAEIIGISKDDASSHEKFKAKHTLNFTLLSDPSGETIEAYGAWGKKMFGKEGILRRTYIINPEGQVVKVFGRVTPLGHGEQAVETLQKLQDEAA